MENQNQQDGLTYQKVLDHIRGEWTLSERSTENMYVASVTFEVMKMDGVNTCTLSAVNRVMGDVQKIKRGEKMPKDLPWAYAASTLLRRYKRYFEERAQ